MFTIGVKDPLGLLKAPPFVLRYMKGGDIMEQITIEYVTVLLCKKTMSVFELVQEDVLTENDIQTILDYFKHIHQMTNLLEEVFTNLMGEFDVSFENK